MTLQFVRSSATMWTRTRPCICVPAHVCVLHMWHARVKIVMRCTWCIASGTCSSYLHICSIVLYAY